MMSHFGCDAPFDNVQDWKRIWEKSKKVKSTKIYTPNDETYGRFHSGCYNSIYCVYI
jgi:hypothetical protein